MLAWVLGGTGCSPKPPEHGTAFLVELDFSTLPPTRAPQAALAGTQEVMRKRLRSFGVRPFIEPVAADRLQIKVGQISPELLDGIGAQLRRPGWVSFRLVHAENETNLNQGITPPGYELKQEILSRPDGTKQSIPLLVAKKPVEGCSGRNIRAAYVTRDPIRRPEIAFKFDEEGTKAFGDLTSTNLQRRLAILVDGEVCSAPVIQSPILGGSGVITGSFTEKEAFELAALLRNPLEVPIKLLEEKSF